VAGHVVVLFWERGVVFWEGLRCDAMVGWEFGVVGERGVYILSWMGWEVGGLLCLDVVSVV